MKVLLVDDHSLFRTAFCNLLEKANLVTEVGHAGNGKEALEILGHSKYDVVFLDIGMPIMNGYDAFDEIRKQHPKTKILILTQHNEKSIILYFVKRGANAFITKAAEVNEIEQALEALKANHKYFSPPILELIKDFLHEIDSHSRKLELTALETKMIDLLGMGLSSKELSKELGLTVNTINTYRERLLIKVGVKNVAELISFAYIHGILLP